MNIFKDLGIVIPTLNSEATILHTLGSLMPFREAGAKVIVVDSYSMDRTRDIAEAYADKILFVPKGNMYAAVNSGVQDIDLTWVTYINSDDMLHFDAAKGALIHCADADVIYGNIDFIDEWSRFLSSWRTAPEWALKATFSVGFASQLQPGTLFRKSIWNYLKGFDESFRYAADFDFFYRALQQGSIFKHAGALPLASFRKHSNQLSLVYAEKLAAEVERAVAQSALPRAPLGTLIKQYCRVRNLDNYLVRIVRRYLNS